MDLKEKSTNFLQHRLQKLQNEINTLFPLMRGSVVSIGVKAKKATYSININGKTKIVYLGKEKDIIAKKWISNYKRLMEIVDEMTLLNVEIIRRMQRTSQK